jgi:Flp pilus assembly protein TadD
MTNRLAALGAAALLSFSLGIGQALAVTTNDPPPPQDSKGKKKKSSDADFLKGYRYAHALIQNGKYAEGIAALHALGNDGHPDVANYLGFAHRKLGHYDEAKVWYTKALEADPRHVRTWQYFGMWHLEQGNRLKAEDFLVQINAICGTDCNEYKLLKEALDGRMSY